MRYSTVPTACALALAACNQGPAVHEENASVAEVQQEVAKATGGDSFVRDVELLNKPFTHDLLTRKVRQILEAEPSTAERQQA